MDIISLVSANLLAGAILFFVRVVPAGCLKSNLGATGSISAHGPHHALFAILHVRACCLSNVTKCYDHELKLNRIIQFTFTAAPHNQPAKVDHQGDTHENVQTRSRWRRAGGNSGDGAGVERVRVAKPARQHRKCGGDGQPERDQSAVRLLPALVSRVPLPLGRRLALPSLSRDSRLSVTNLEGGGAPPSFPARDTRNTTAQPTKVRPAGS